MRKIHSLKAICATALAVLIYACSFIYFAATAQDTPQSTAKPTATPAPIIEEKKKPVILEKPQLLELNNLELRQENARLKAEAAIPQAVKDEMKAVNEALDKFWAERGIKRDELRTKWVGSEGVGGAIILTPVAEPEKKVESPAPKK